MATCASCGGLMAEPGKIYGYSGKFCDCHLGKNPVVVEVDSKKDHANFMRELEKQRKNDYKKTVDNIIGLCSTLNQEQLKAVATLIATLHDCRAKDE